jgi:hypothetical protein
VSKQRAARRAEREAAAKAAAAQRERSRARNLRIDTARSRLMTPARATHGWWQRFVVWFRRRSNGQRVLVIVWTALVLVALVRAETWGTRLLVLGLSCLLLPVAWTLVPGRRR